MGNESSVLKRRTVGQKGSVLDRLVGEHNPMSLEGRVLNY
jgi:hypothetical protein